MQWSICHCIEMIRRLYASGHTAFQKFRYCQTHLQCCIRGCLNAISAADDTQERAIGCLFIWKIDPPRCRGPPVRSSIKNSDKEVIRYEEAE